MQYSSIIPSTTKRCGKQKMEMTTIEAKLWRKYGHTETLLLARVLIKLRHMLPDMSLKK